MAKLPPTELSQSSPEDCLPPWMLAMRKAAREAISTQDITEIVKSQVDRAKKGDQKAIDFVFGQLLGSNELKGATFVQNVFQGDSPTKPAKVKAGSEQKVALMRKRIAAGAGAFHPDDGEEVDLS